MRVTEYRNGTGQVISFEIANVGRSRVLRFLGRTFPSATIVNQDSDDFALIELDGRHFVVNEAWGDNSRYIIHEETPQPSGELNRLQLAFEQYHPSWMFSGDRSFGLVIAILGGILGCIVLAVVFLSRG